MRERLNERRIWSRGPLLLLLLVVTSTFAGCNFFGGVFSDVAGQPVPAQYTGMQKKSILILVYTDSSTEFLYPQARREVSSFVGFEIRKHLPKSKLLDSSTVIAYQNNTPGWDALPVKTIGKHFGVDRVLYIEIIQYHTHSPGARHLMRGHIEAHIAVYNTHLPGSGRVFSTQINTYWPKSGPEPVFHTDSNAVLYNTLQRFSQSVVRCFYPWTAHPE
jgi:hypothetical protein